MRRTPAAATSWGTWLSSSPGRSTGGKGNGETGDSANGILDYSQTKGPGADSIEVLIDNYPTARTSSSTKSFVAAYHGSADGHYESIEKYLPQLVATSKNLK